MYRIQFRFGYAALGLIMGLAMVFGATGAALAGEPDTTPTAFPLAVNSEEVYLPIIVRHSEDNDCSAIQSAIDSLPESGGQVIVSAGTFECSTALIINRSNVDLRGQGPATVLYLADGSNTPVIVIGDTATPIGVNIERVRLRDMTIDGNKVGQTAECWGGPCDTGGLTFIRNNGVTIRGASDVEIERVAVYRARSGGLVTEKGCRRLTVRDFTAAENFFDGIAGYETEDSLFSGLHLHDNLFAGMSLDIQFNNNIVSDALITNNGKQGIFMRDSRDNLFSSIQIRDSGEQGVFLAQVDDDPSKPASGNTFESLVVSNSTQAGLRVNDPSCINNLIVAAQFIENSECIRAPDPELVQQYAIICR